jgi:hypothetical protein
LIVFFSQPLLQPTVLLRDACARSVGGFHTLLVCGPCVCVFVGLWVCSKGQNVVVSLKIWDSLLLVWLSEETFGTCNSTKKRPLCFIEPSSTQIQSYKQHYQISWIVTIWPMRSFRVHGTLIRRAWLVTTPTTANECVHPQQDKD